MKNKKLVTVLTVVSVIILIASYIAFSGTVYAKPKEPPVPPPPIGGNTITPNNYPTGDDANTGNFTVVPNLYQKVDDTSNTDYITGVNNNGGYATFTFTAFAIPAGSTNISLTITYSENGGGTSATHRGEIKVGGNYYGNTNAATTNGFQQQTYVTTLNPKSGSNWTVAEINGTDPTNPLQAFGVGGGDFNPDVQFGYCYATVTYTPPVVAPTVTISSASSITSTGATLNGNVTDTGTENPTVTTYWGDNDGGQVIGNWDFNSAPDSPAQPQGVAAFTKAASSLTPGTLYYFSAKATNSGGTGWPAASLSFYTLPGDPSNLASGSQTSVSIDLTWTKGTGGDKTMIRYRSDGTYPTSPSDGTQGYFDTGTSTTLSGLSASTTYKIRAWACDTDPTPDNYSSGTSDLTQATPAAPVVATITLSTATSVGSTTARLNGNITATGGDNPTVTVYWGDNDGGQVVGDWDSSASPTSPAQPQGIVAFYYDASGLAAGTTIYFSAKATNSAGTAWPANSLSFLTIPAAPTGVNATDGDFPNKVVITWNKSTGATKYKVLRGAVNDSGDLGDVATWDDTAGAAPTITPGTVDATDGTQVAYVTCTLSGQSASAGATESYTVYAGNATGYSAASSANNGNKGTTVLTYQWQMSDADSDADYNTNLTGGTTNPFNATEAPSNGDKRYFRAKVSMTGASDAYSTGNEGWRMVIVVPTITISAASSVTSTGARLNGNVTATGNENPTVTVYYGDNDGLQVVGNWDSNHVPTSPAQPQGVVAFYYDASGLNPGTQYYFSAKATNSAGTSWPVASLNFYTLPNAPTELDSTSQTESTIYISWVKGTGANKTMVRYRTDGTYPTSPSNGTQAYFNTGTNYTILGLSATTTLKIRLWSFAVDDVTYSSTTADLTIVTTAVGTGRMVFYPDAHPESTSVDGIVDQNNWDGGDTWTNLRNGVGNEAYQIDKPYIGVVFIPDGFNTNKWAEIDRTIILFDTNIPINAIITSATISVCGYGSNDDPDNNKPDFNIYSASPISNTDLTGEDYSTVGLVAFSQPIAFDDYNDSGYMDFILNSNGIANITKGGISKFSIRNANFDVANIAPVWNPGYGTQIMFYASEKGFGYKPKLVVNYSLSTFIPKITWW